MAPAAERVRRLFIAVDIDDKTRGQIGEVVSAARALLAAPARITWVDPERLHLTLHFFGSADAELEHRVHTSLADVIPIAPFDLAFGGPGFFPPRGSPRVLWLGLRAGLTQVRLLHDVLESRIALRSGAHGEFRPHLTLARFRDRVSKPDVAKLGAMPASAGPCRIDRVTLYESRLSPEGPRYSTLAQASLMPVLPCT